MSSAEVVAVEFSDDYFHDGMSVPDLPQVDIQRLQHRNSIARLQGGWLYLLHRWHSFRDIITTVTHFVRSQYPGGLRLVRRRVAQKACSDLERAEIEVLYDLVIESLQRAAGPVSAEVLQ